MVRGIGEFNPRRYPEIILKLKLWQDLEQLLAADDKGKTARLHVQVFNKSVITGVNVSPKDRQTRHCFDKYIPKCSHL